MTSILVWDYTLYINVYSFVILLDSGINSEFIQNCISFHVLITVLSGYFVPFYFICTIVIRIRLAFDIMSNLYYDNYKWFITKMIEYLYSETSW